MIHSETRSGSHNRRCSRFGCCNVPIQLRGFRRVLRRLLARFRRVGRQRIIAPIVDLPAGALRRRDRLEMLALFLGRPFLLPLYLERGRLLSACEDASFERGLSRGLGGCVSERIGATIAFILEITQNVGPALMPQARVDVLADAIGSAFRPRGMSKKTAFLVRQEVAAKLAAESNQWQIAAADIVGALLAGLRRPGTRGARHGTSILRL